MPTYISPLRQDWSARGRRPLQGLLIGAHGLMETSLRNLDIRQDNGAPIAGEMYPARCTFAMPSAAMRRAAVEIPIRSTRPGLAARLHHRASDSRPAGRDRAPA